MSWPCSTNIPPSGAELVPEQREAPGAARAPRALWAPLALLWKRLRLCWCPAGGMQARGASSQCTLTINKRPCTALSHPQRQWGIALSWAMSTESRQRGANTPPRAGLGAGRVLRGCGQPHGEPESVHKTSTPHAEGESGGKAEESRGRRGPPPISKLPRGCRGTSTAQPRLGAVPRDLVEHPAPPSPWIWGFLHAVSRLQRCVNGIRWEAWREADLERLRSGAPPQPV